MMTCDNLSRRAFLGVLTHLALVGWLGSARGARAPAEPVTGDERLRRQLVDLLHHPESARVVGWQYLRQAPDQADRDTLLASLRANCPELHAELGPAHVKTVLHRQQRRDFEQGRTVNVAGWILSRTEAQLCALAALS